MKVVLIHPKPKQKATHRRVLHIVFRLVDSFSQIETGWRAGCSTSGTPFNFSQYTGLQQLSTPQHYPCTEAFIGKKKSKTFWHGKCNLLLSTSHSEARHPHLKKVGSSAFFGRAVALPLTRLTVVGRSCRVGIPLFLLRGVSRKPLVKGSHLTLSYSLR